MGWKNTPHCCWPNGKKTWAQLISHSKKPPHRSTSYFFLWARTFLNRLPQGDVQASLKYSTKIQNGHNTELRIFLWAQKRKLKGTSPR